jgi:signal transduction histidine kinase
VERRVLVLLDTAVPVLVGAVIVAVAVLNGAHAQSRPWIVGLLAAGTLAARRRAPLSTLVASSTLVLVLMHLDSRIGAAAVLAPATALFSLAIARGRAQQIAGAVVAAGLVIGAEMAHTGQASPGQTLAHLALVSIPLLAAEAHRTRRSNLALLVDQLAASERGREQEAERRVEQERLRIARELHDIVAHTLTVINVQAATAAHLIDRDPGYARTALSTIEDASRDATAELRAILGVLRDRNHPDAPTAPIPGIDGLDDLIKLARRGGVNANLTVLGAPPPRLLDAVSLAAYRIVQESLTNTQRHSAGTTVNVELHYSTAAVSIAVYDNGGGPPTTASPGSGVGLIGMRERATALGGSLDAGPGPDGFRVDATLPYTISRG